MGGMLTNAIEFWSMQWLVQIGMNNLLYIVNIFLMQEGRINEVQSRSRLKQVKNIFLHA